METAADPIDETGHCKLCGLSSDDNLELFNQLTTELDQVRKDLEHEIELNFSFARTHKNLHDKIAKLEYAARLDKATISSLWEEIYALRGVR